MVPLFPDPVRPYCRETAAAAAAGLGGAESGLFLEPRCCRQLAASPLLSGWGVRLSGGPSHGTASPRTPSTAGESLLFPGGKRSRGAWMPPGRVPEGKPVWPAEAAAATSNRLVLTGADWFRFRLQRPYMAALLFSRLIPSTGVPLLLPKVSELCPFQSLPFPLLMGCLCYVTRA